MFSWHGSYDKNNKLTNMMALYNVSAVLQIIGCVETNYRNDNNRYVQEFHYAKKRKI